MTRASIAILIVDVDEGYRFLMCAPVRSYGHLDKARAAAGIK